jgi:hypothetical protein
MSYSRELLKSREPELYNALENAWKIALKDVFPTMYSKDESINSQPHSQNLENYLNSILEQHHELFEDGSVVNISSYELYCILMAILFHDFGRIKFDAGHGSFSKLYVINNYQKFFIPTVELADAIGDICEIHKPIEKDKTNQASVLLDAGKGRIRIRELADLLKLVDEMDTSYRRLKDLYVLDQPKYFGGKGLFRNYIKGISYDRYAQAIVVAIDNKLIENTEIDELKWDCLIFNNIDTKDYNDFIPSKYKDDLLEFINEELKDLIPSISIYRDQYEQIIANKKKLFVEQKFVPDFLTNIKVTFGSKRMFPVNDKENIINEILDINESEHPDEFFRLFYYYFNYYRNEFKALLSDIEDAANQKWPFYVVVALILRAINNCEEKSTKSSYLPRFGIKVKKWMLYYKEHLYDTSGKETVEPIFNENYLKMVVNSMWELSTMSWGKTWISFNDLSYKILERDIKRLKLAVQRIEILMRDVAQQKGVHASIDYDNEEWCWVREKNKFVSIEEALNKIKSVF